MKYVWLLILPLFCLPDLLFAQQTSIGTLKWTDYLIVPYCVSILAAGGAKATPETRRLTTYLAAFGAWALLSTLTIQVRYGYSADYFTNLGLAKLAKFALYAAAGVGTMHVMARSPKLQAWLRWSLLAAVLCGSLSVYITASVFNDLPNAPHEAGFHYEATNAVSVLISMLLAFVLGEWAARTKHLAWRNIGVVLLPVLVVGFFLTGGRGGWVSLFIALAYVLVRAGLRPSFVLGGFVLLLSATAVYSQNEDFSHHVDITINPELLAEETEFAQATGFDDGNRVYIFINQSGKLLISPVLGAGLYHRGGASGLYPTGSHNFFLQMFLETGLVGGLAMVVCFHSLWRMSRAGADAAQTNLGSRAALIAAIGSGFTGEYFYGGAGLLMLLVLIAPALGEATHSEAPELGPLAAPRPANIGIQPHA